MAPPTKRPRENDELNDGPAAKKHRKGIRVGPENLPDGPWKRKGNNWLTLTHQAANIVANE